MKTLLFLSVAILLLFLTGNTNSQELTSKNSNLQMGVATINCTPDVYELAEKWAWEYNRLNSANKIQVVKIPYNDPGLSTSDNLSLVTSKSQSLILDEKNWKVVLGRDIIVPVMNAGNPFLNVIAQQGISQEQFAQVLNNPDKQYWGALLAGLPDQPVHIYISNDESVKAGMTKFLQVPQIPVKGITLGTKDEIISAIQKDPYAIGFCNVTQVMVPGNQNLIENLRFLPVDKNGNGILDYMEEIYSDANTFLRGVWIGKYPKNLYNTVYAVNSVLPTNQAEIAFLTWVLADGQQYMNAVGFSQLADNESLTQLAKLNTAQINVSPVQDASQTGLILLVLAVLITLALLISAGVRSYRKQENVMPEFSLQPDSFDEEGIVLPRGIFFDKSHTWAFREKDGTISVGIDDFLQHITGPITRIEMKNPGEKIRKGDLLFSIIQSGKQLSLYSPVSGIIRKQNEALITDTSIINSSPYNEGWVYMIEPANWNKEILVMEMAEKYKRWIENEFSRVKDFLAAKLKPESIEYTHLVMQDGGVLREGVLSDFGPEVWEDFQTNFLDNYK